MHLDISLTASMFSYNPDNLNTVQVIRLKFNGNYVNQWLLTAQNESNVF